MLSLPKNIEENAPSTSEPPSSTLESDALSHNAHVYSEGMCVIHQKAKYFVKKKRKRKKRRKQDVQSHETVQSDDDYYPRFLTIKRLDEDFSRVSPILLHKLLAQEFGQLKSCKKLHNGCLCVEVFSREQAHKVMEAQELGDFDVVVMPYWKTTTSQGVIICKDLLNSSVEEIAEELLKQGVIDVQRIERHHNKDSVPTAALVLTFNCPKLPSLIDIAFYRLRVRPYIEDLLQCFKCGTYGHTAVKCPVDAEDLKSISGEEKNPSDSDRSDLHNQSVNADIDYGVAKDDISSDIPHFEDDTDSGKEEKLVEEKSEKSSLKYIDASDDSNSKRVDIMKSGRSTSTEKEDVVLEEITADSKEDNFPEAVEHSGGLLEVENHVIMVDKACQTEFELPSVVIPIVEPIENHSSCEEIKPFKGKTEPKSNLRGKPSLLKMESGVMKSQSKSKQPPKQRPGTPMVQKRASDKLPLTKPTTANYRIIDLEELKAGSEALNAFIKKMRKHRKTKSNPGFK